MGEGGESSANALTLAHTLRKLSFKLRMVCATHPIPEPHREAARSCADDCALVQTVGA